MRVYVFRGDNGEKVPKLTQKLIVKEGVQVLPHQLCFNEELDYSSLQQVVLPTGFRIIGGEAFRLCGNLVEISIPNTVQLIGEGAFRSCSLLKNVKFESSESVLPDELQTIGKEVFRDCGSLQRIKLSSLVARLGKRAFLLCDALMEADLSTTRIANISEYAFSHCSSLRTVSLPVSLESIQDEAFFHCVELVTVVVPLASQGITIGDRAFGQCWELATLVIPTDSDVEEECFSECHRLNSHFGGEDDSDAVIDGLKYRFGDLSVHEMCYDHVPITVSQLRESIMEELQQDESIDHDWLFDTFEMTPLHVFFSTLEPRMELLEVLLELLPNPNLVLRKDINEKRPLDYLLCNWSDISKSLFQKTCQKWMIDRLASWGATLWMETIQTKITDVLQEDAKEQRIVLCKEVCIAMDQFENIQATSILEMALWKKRLKSGWNHGGDDDDVTIKNLTSKRQALDREECRCTSGSNVVIPLVVAWLGL